MSGKVFLILLSFLVISSFKKDSPGTPALQDILAVYNRADRLFNTPNTSPATDSSCMADFRHVILDLNILPRNSLKDSLLYHCNYKLGILYEVYKNYSSATEAYLQAVKFSPAADEKFMNTVLAGAGYYNLNNFDSASYLLLHAAEMPANVGAYEDRERLYNTLGVLYYDNGNYLQSKNYFTQALYLIKKNNPKAILDENTIQLNIATCYYNLGLYEQALGLYREIQNNKLLPDPFYMNLGRTYAGLQDYSSALIAFKKVKVNKVPGVLNEMAKTALASGNTDSAKVWLAQFRNEKKLFHTNALDDGVNELYYGDLDIRLDRPDSALRHYQEALNIFSRDFAETDIRKNPGSFTGSFAYYRLFEVLLKKAAAWELLFQKTSMPSVLQEAFNTYQSTISLLSYIERSYEMDDAKILLKQKSGEVYSKALHVCLALNRLFPKADYLESAFQVIERNKASIMRSQIRERKFLMSDGAENDLMSQERNIKFNIARLNSKADGRTDASALQTINDEKSAYETQLVNLRRKMEKDSRFYKLKYSEDFPSLREMQDKMTSDQALISFYNEPDTVGVFVLTKSALNHFQLDSADTIRHHIQAWIQYLQNPESGRNENVNALKKELFGRLMEPILRMAGDKKEWIIVPDGLFFLLPIETLAANKEGRLVLEDHAVSYEFSAGFIMREKGINSDLGTVNQVLSFAPFSQQSADLKKEGMGLLEKLPYSKEEISTLNGRSFADQQATKSAFLKNLNGFPIIHLATHAVTDLENPSASFIAFSPASGNHSDDFLFLDEIYSLRMDGCKLIVISACETGRGEWVSNEGVMSFARAFLYSGCPSTINTLWKADDLSTSLIIKSFYKYLLRGCSKSIALQKAKLDFIQENPLYRDPSFWSHIVLTGDPAALYKKKQPWFWAVLSIGFGTIIFFSIRKRKEKKADAFHS